MKTRLLPKGILYINQSLSMGGAESFNLQLLNWFYTKKVPIKVWSTSDLFIKQFELRGISSTKIPVVVDIVGDWKGFVKGVFYIPFAFLYYANLVYKNRNNGVIFLTGFIEKILVTPWAHLFNVPIVWIEFGPLKPLFLKSFGIPKRLYNFVCRLPDYIVESTESTKKQNSSITKYVENKVRVLPCGIEPLVSIKNKTQKNSVYCVSRMERGKGQDILIKAWLKVLSTFPDAKLYFIGNGDFRLVLENMVNELKLRKSVEFLGWVTDLPGTISKFSIGVFPSAWNLEGFGIVLLEAMSLRKPIICSDIPPYMEIVDKKSALIFEKNNIDNLSDMIITLFRNQSLCKTMVTNAESKFEKKFTINIVAKKYNSIFVKAQSAHAKSNG